MTSDIMKQIGDFIQNIKNGKSAAHAYLVEGRSHEARNAFIAAVSEGLGCTGLDEVRMMMSGKASYKVSDAAAFSDRLMMGAYGEYLLGAIEDADSMPETVQNKLLKTIEEPGPSVILLLGTSNPDRLLDTVRSRCSVIRLAEYGQGSAGSEDAAGTEEISAAAALMTDGAAFYESRDAINKCVKSKEDALAVIDAVEDRLHARMADGEVRAAENIELAEKARADISRDMDKTRALKRLFLEIQ